MIETQGDGQHTNEAANSWTTIRRNGSRISVLLIAVDLVFFALWLGGLVTIGAIVAPVTFHFVRQASSLNGLAQTQNLLAGSIIGGSLRVYNIVAATCGIWLTARTLASSGNFALADIPSISARLTLIAPAAVSLVVTAVQALALFPAMDSAQAAGRLLAFDTLHHRYELLSQLQLLLLLAFAFRYARLLSRRIAL